MESPIERLTTAGREGKCRCDGEIVRGDGIGLQGDEWLCERCTATLMDESTDDVRAKAAAAKRARRGVTTASRRAPLVSAVVAAVMDRMMTVDQVAQAVGCSRTDASAILRDLLADGAVMRQWAYSARPNRQR